MKMHGGLSFGLRNHFSIWISFCVDLVGLVSNLVWVWEHFRLGWKEFCGEVCVHSNSILFFFLERQMSCGHITVGKNSKSLGSDFQSITVILCGLLYYLKSPAPSELPPACLSLQEVTSPTPFLPALAMEFTLVKWTTLSRNDLCYFSVEHLRLSISLVLT